MKAVMAGVFSVVRLMIKIILIDIEFSRCIYTFFFFTGKVASI